MRFRSSLPKSRNRARLCIEWLEDRNLPSILVTTAADNGDNANPIPGSLRQAILQADAGPGGDTINIQIGKGPQVIQPLTPLPPLTIGTDLFGEVQPASVTMPAIALTTLDGSKAGSSDGLVLKTTNSIVLIDDLIVTHFSGNGIMLTGTTPAFVGGCTITQNGGTGVVVQAGSTVTLTGSEITSNAGRGVLLNSDFNTVSGNFIGTDPTGTQQLGNGGDGIGIAGNSNTIGTANPQRDTNATNLVFYNGGAGVKVGIGGAAVDANFVQETATFGNAAGGIVLAPGADGNVAAPVIMSAVSNAAGTLINYTFQGFPNTTYSVEGFNSPPVDPSGINQGQQSLVLQDVMTDGTGHAAGLLPYFTVVPVGNVVTLTATLYNSPGGTSSLSAGVVVKPNTTPIATNTFAGGGVIALGQPVFVDASVKSALGIGTPTGMVTFSDETGMLGSAPLINGIADLQVMGGLPLGPHTITAVYGGDSLFSGSMSLPSTLTIKLGSKTVVTSAPFGIIGQPLTLTVQVSPTPPATGIPTGTVSFVRPGFDGPPTSLGQVTLDSQGVGVLTIITPGPLPPGGLGLGLIVTYSGDSIFAPSQALPDVRTVYPAGIDLGSSPNPAHAGQLFTLSATVRSFLTPFQPSETVTFFDGTTELGTVTTNSVDRGSSFTALLMTSLNTPGIHQITARYSGDAGLAPGSATLDVTILPPPDPDTAFVTALYTTILKRGPDDAGLGYWFGQLQANMSRQQVAAGFWESREHRGLQVDAFYETYLHRAADQSGRDHWVNAFEAGMTETDVALGILASPEYSQNHSTVAAFVNALYADVLGRTPDPAGLAFWTNLAQTAQGRIATAQGLFLSTEKLLQILETYYADFLSRTPDVTGEQTWLFEIQTHRGTLTTVAEGFFGSPEFFAHAKEE
jgi:hypothetical protein